MRWQRGVCQRGHDRDIPRTAHGKPGIGHSRLRPNGGGPATLVAKRLRTEDLKGVTPAALAKEIAEENSVSSAREAAKVRQRPVRGPPGGGLLGEQRQPALWKGHGIGRADISV
jgi:hypothetical protein